MIVVENGIQLGTSTQRLMRRLSVKNYDVVIGTKRSSDPLSSEVIPRQHPSAGRPNERPSSSHSASSQRLLVESEPGSLMNWDKSLTLKLKSWLNSNLGLSIDHLVRTNDLGLKTAKGVSAVGVILTASHTTKSGLDSVRSGSVLVIPPSSWSALQTEIRQFAGSRHTKICILDLQRNYINFI
jgi:hypothetical protein